MYFMLLYKIDVLEFVESNSSEQSTMDLPSVDHSKSLTNLFMD
jgi:hypothetical protein